MAKTAVSRGSIRGTPGTTPGVTTTAVASGAATPDASAGKGHHRITTGANVTVNLATGSVDSQRVMIEIVATAALTVTLVSSYDLGGSGRSRVFPVGSGKRALVFVINVAGTLRVLSIDDGG